MADNSILDYLVTFIDEATTSLAVASYETKKDVNQISGQKKCLIFPWELVTVDKKKYKIRTLIKISMENEANLTSIINEIILGCYNFNSRTGGFTYPTSMMNIETIYSRRGFVTTDGRWEIDLYLDSEWSVE